MRGLWLRVARAALLVSCCAAAGCNAIFGLDPARLTPPDAADHDAVADVGSVPPGVDAGVDAGGMDAGVDHAQDAGVDAAPDAGKDAADAHPLSDGGGGEPLVSGCKGIHGPTPVNIEGMFCIDSTEVTNAQYAEFLAATSPSEITQPAPCAWNTSFVPGSFPYGAGQDNVPVMAMDYCDAWSYCAWAGKRLCGRVGHNTAMFNDVLNGEVYYACSGGAAHPYTYTYGNTYNANNCDTDMFRLDPVKSNPACVSNVYPGLYDLSGNVAVWMDMCEPDTTDGMMDVCRLSTPLYSDYTCGAMNYLQRYFQSGTTGMRCCSDVE
jgi:hypothetical protein